MAYPVPMAGAFQPQQPAGLINPLVQPLPQADDFKAQKSPSLKLQMKGGDATVVTRTGSEDRFGTQHMVFFSCAVLASGSDLSQGCPLAMDHVDPSTASSEYWFTLSWPCFNHPTNSGGSDHEG